MNTLNYDTTIEDAVEANGDLLGNCKTCGKKVFDYKPHKTVCESFKGKNGKLYPRDLYCHVNEFCEVEADETVTVEDLSDTIKEIEKVKEKTVGNTKENIISVSELLKVLPTETLLAMLIIELREYNEKALTELENIHYGIKEANRHLEAIRRNQ